jgi:phage gpG-like protein
VQQFGGVSHWAEYGEDWNIPPRPFLGVSAKDKQDILQIIDDYLLSAL